jgi:hypothetical protein
MKLSNIYETVINEYVSQHNLQKIEHYLDSVFKALNIDIEFSGHFLDRINDPRNGKEIESQEIINTFNRLYKKHGQGLTNYNKETEAVITDLNNNINIPFVLKYDKNSDEFQIMNKTIMRKKNFQSSNRKFKV